MSHMEMLNDPTGDCTNHNFCLDKTLMPQADKENALSVNQSCREVELI